MKRSTRSVVSKSARMSNLAQGAYDIIRESIMNNDFKPGDCLSENALANSLGMSRTPIREAIKVLSSEGLIESHNGVGAFIKHVTVKEIHDIFEVRSALECVAVDAALASITDEEIDRIEAEWLALYENAMAGRPSGWSVLAQQDYDLHEFLVTKCNNDYIIDIVEGIRTKITRFQRISAASLGDELDTIRQHLRLIALMKRRDVEGLKQELNIHIMHAKDLILKNPNVRY